MGLMAMGVMLMGSTEIVAGGGMQQQQGSNHGGVVADNRQIL